MTSTVNTVGILGQEVFLEETMTVQLIQTYPQQMEFLAAYLKVQFEVPLAFELCSLGHKNSNSKTL